MGSSSLSVELDTDSWRLCVGKDQMKCIGGGGMDTLGFYDSDWFFLA